MKLPKKEFQRGVRQKESQKYLVLGIETPQIRLLQPREVAQIWNALSARSVVSKVEQP